MTKKNKIDFGKEYLANRLHGASDFGADPVKLAQVPYWNLDHAVVQARLETGRCLPRHRIDLKSIDVFEINPCI